MLRKRQALGVCDWVMFTSFVKARVEVKHILEPGKVSEHKLTPYAVISDDGIVTYPSPAIDKTEGKMLFEP